MKEPEAIDELILRSILGETSRKEEKELRAAFSQDPTLFERRRKLAETTRLLAEVHGVPTGEPLPKTEATPIWLRSLRGITSVGSGIAAGLLILFLLFPTLDRVREIQPGEFQMFPVADADRETPLPMVTTAPALPADRERSDPRGGVASAPPSPTLPTESEGAEIGQITEGPTRQSVREELLREVSRSWQQPRGAEEGRPVSEELTAEFDMVAGFSSNENNRSALSGDATESGAPLDDLFASPPRSQSSPQSFESGPPAAEKKAKNIRLGGGMPLMGQLSADEAVGSNYKFDNEVADLEMRDNTQPPTRSRKPQSPPPPPPPAATFTDTGRDNFSTFSLNVTDVSFQLAARQLEQGIAPDPVSIRQEEFYNAFDYRDPAPASGEPIRFEVESATLPGSHNLKVVRLAVKTAAQSRSAGKPAQITFAVDNSGSMQRSDRKSTIQAAFANLTDGLRPRDRINVVTFATDSRVELLQSPPSNAPQIQAALNTAPEGGTNLEEGLATAYEIAARYYHPAYENRVVLLSDGIANLGRTEADQLVGMIEKNRNQGISFDGFGIGWENLNDPLLAELARNGDGQYAFLNSPEDAGKIFAQALSNSLQAVARDVKVQVEWNPDRVQRFRLIGYETHLLKKEDFRNDAVDAAEMAPEETGNAIYLVELQANGTGPLGTARVRFKMDSATTTEERSWIIPNPPVWPEIESASPRLQLGTAAAILADKLQDPNRFAAVGRAQLLAWTQQAQAFFKNPPEIETLANMIRNANFLQ